MIVTFKIQIICFINNSLANILNDLLIELIATINTSRTPHIYLVSNITLEIAKNNHTHITKDRLTKIYLQIINLTLLLAILKLKISKTHMLMTLFLNSIKK